MTAKVEVLATRRITLGDMQYAKGDKFVMSSQQFRDLAPTGIVKRAPASVPQKRVQAPRQGASATKIDPTQSSPSAD